MKLNCNSRNNYRTTNGILDLLDDKINQYVLDTSDVTFNNITASGNILVNNSATIMGDTIIAGNLVVSGNSTIISTNIVDIKDNIILINSGETGPGVTANLSGLEIDRGSLPNYELVFQESSELFKVGMIGNLQAVATREDNPLHYGIMVYDPVDQLMYSTQTIPLQTTFSAGIQSSSNTSGSLLVSGGIGVSGDVSVRKINLFGTDYSNNISSNSENSLLLNSSNNIQLNLPGSIIIPTNRVLNFGSSSIIDLSNNLNINSPQGNIVFTTSSGGNVSLPVGTSLRWNSFNSVVYNGSNLVLNSNGEFVVNSGLTITNTTSSTSPLIGSVKLSGGLAINNTAESSSSSNGGSFTTNGGVAISKQLIIGGALQVGDIGISKTQVLGQGINIRSRSRVLSTNSGIDTAFNSFEGGSIQTSATITNSSTVYISGSPVILTGNSGVIVNSYSLRIVSGLSFFGGNIVSTGAFQSSNTLSTTSTLNSTSPISGSITTSGGVGISGNIFIGGKIDTGNSPISSAQVFQEGINFRSRNRQITTTSTSDTTFNSFEGGMISFSGVIPTATTLNISGSPVISGGGVINNSYSLWVNSGVSRFDGKVISSNTTPSTSSNSASVVLSGGMSISETSDSISSANGGSITTSGGIGIAKTLRVGLGVITESGLTDHIKLQTSNLNRWGIALNGEETGLNTGSDFKINRFTDTGVVIDSPITIFRNSGVLFLGNSTSSSSSSTGAVVLSGGLSINNSTNSSSITNGGSITTSGGISVAKDTYIGGNSNMSGSLTVGGTSNLGKLSVITDNGQMTISGTNGLTATLGSTSVIKTVSGSMSLGADTGVLNLSGSLGVLVSSTGNSSVICGGIYSISSESLVINSGNGDTSITSSKSITTSSGVGGTFINSSDSVSIATTNSAPVNVGSVNSLINLKGNVVVGGNLLVSGETTTINSEIITIKDIAIVVNDAPNGTSDGGFLIHRWQPPNNNLIGDLVSGVIKETGTFGSGSATPGTLVLNSSGSGINNHYRGWWISINSGVGANQVRRIKAYNGATKVATIFTDSDNNTTVMAPIFTDGLDLSIAPVSGDSYRLFDSPYAGVYFSAEAQEMRFAGVSFDASSGVFGTPTTYYDIHANSIVIESGFVANGTTDITGRLSCKFTDTSAFYVAKSDDSHVFTVDTQNSIIRISNPSNAVNTFTSTITSQRDNSNNIIDTSRVASYLLDSTPGEISSNTVFSVQKPGQGLVEMLSLSGSTGTIDTSSNVVSVRINGTASSVSGTTGALIVAGGITSASTTDSISSSNGGSLTLAGGASVAKTLFVGGVVNVVSNSKVPVGSNTLGNGSFNTTGDITMNNSSSQGIYFAGSGSDVPTFTSRSLGSKIILKCSVSSTLTDFCIGTSSDSMWFSVPDSTSHHSFYTGITEQVRLDSTGVKIQGSGKGLTFYNGASITSSSGNSIEFSNSESFTFKGVSQTSVLKINSNGQLSIGENTSSLSSESNTAIIFSSGGSTFTDSTTGSVAGTVAFNKFLQSSVAASVATETQRAINTFIGGAPIQGQNQTILDVVSLFLDAGEQITSTFPINTGSTLYIKGSPVGNITNKYSINVESGVSLFNGRMVIASQTKVGDSNTITSSSSGLSSMGDINLYNDTSQGIYFKGSGAGIPAFTTRSLGSKIILSPQLSGSSGDSSIGVSGNSLWFAVPTQAYSHSFYLGVSERLKIDSIGLQLSPESIIRPATNDTHITISGASSVGASVKLFGNSGVVSPGNAVISSSGSGDIVFNTTVNNALVINSVGDISVSNGVDSTGTLTGSVSTTGGMNIDKSLFVGSKLVLNFNQPYQVSGNNLGNIDFQSLVSGASFEHRSFTKDGDNTDNIFYDIYSFGTPLSLTNSEFVRTGFSVAEQSYIMTSNATGTGIIRPIVIHTQGNTNQIKLLTNGGVSLSSTTSSTSSVSGALVVSGGVGISSSTNSSSPDNGGSITVAGGMAIKKDAYVGGNTFITGSVSASSLSAGVGNPSVAATPVGNVSGTVSVINPKTITNGTEVLFSVVFRLTPTVSNTTTLFEFVVPGISSFTNTYDIVLTANGYTSDNTNIENITGYAVSGSGKALLKFTSGGTGIQTIMVIARYTSV